MHSGPFLEDPAFTIALALAVGMIAQVVARHLRLPGIVLLLAAGAALGPDGLGWVRPTSLGATLQTLVGYAVAVILFEGGLQLNLKRLRRQAGPIRGLVTTGALITAVGGTLAARWIMDWPWSVAALFGTLVIVTGPTVITPLLRRMRLQSETATVLEAEGVFGDAIGALVAVVTLEIVLTPYSATLGHSAWELVERLGFGALAGVAGGLVMAFLLRYERLVPDGLDNVVTLSLALLLYQASNAFLEESGIVAVIAAGMTVGNSRGRLVEELKDFKEQLTVMLIGLLFVLLAADVRLADLRALGWPAVATAVALIAAVRPLNVWLGTRSSDLDLRQKAFIAAMAPRGIVAAAVASLFAQRLADSEMPYGTELRALVFLVIAVTVTFYGLLGSPLARVLELRRKPKGGYAILGANAVARVLARALATRSQDVTLMDSNPQACQRAEDAGLRVLFGSGLADRILQRAELDERHGAIAMTPNDGINYSFARRAKYEFSCPRVWVALGSDRSEVRPSMLEEIDARRLFGGVLNLGTWSHRLDRGGATLQVWAPDDGGLPVEVGAEDALPLAWKGDRRAVPFEAFDPPIRGASLLVLTNQRTSSRVEEAFVAAGWRLESSRDPVEGSTATRDRS